MKKLFLFSSFCFFSSISFSQTGVETQKKAESVNDPKLAEFKKQHDERIAQSIQPSVYFGYDETLKSFFINNIIPGETPKADGTVTKDEYVKVLNEWLSKNMSLLKPEHKNSIIK